MCSARATRYNTAPRPVSYISHFHYRPTAHAAVQPSQFVNARAYDVARKIWQLVDLGTSFSVKLTDFMGM
ncbi:uncharacterized protein M421DRAFT_418006 [Didymella exigua CBS 183.55]|uniref:Uncharacterized protein n=1 Tax=Didymella exigua CBS 183.55 TaxID=1150837 RepID=A0A6A5S1H5_9PLEO|nr:uncharacterized protein M421DRAFT_418006 [Didymella exigua CBS 183.55]KAF1931367.1 hypothetical protein M421DRAFT_418006 [Didymella exigua CBS 183.55]